MSCSQQEHVIFYSRCHVNLQLILSLIMEHSPDWILNESRQEWIWYAIETKDLAFLRILTQTIDPFIPTSELLKFAAGIEDNLPILKYLVSLNCPVEPLDRLKALTSAVGKKAFENLKFLHEKMEFPIDDNCRVFSSAAGIEDNIEIMEYLVSHNCPTDYLITSKSAAENGALNNLKWLLENGFSMEDEVIFKAAIESGSLETLKWLKGKNSFCCSEDSLGTLKWTNLSDFTFYLLHVFLMIMTRRDKCPCREFWCKKIDSSLEECSIGTIEWLIKQGIEIDPACVFKGAAKHGHVDKMEWLFEKYRDSIEDPEIFEAAVEYGSLENLEWLLKNGCPIHDSDIFAEAARQGHFDIMKWLLEKKCPIDDSEILVAAAEFGSIEQMEWLLDNKCPIDNNSRIFEKAAIKGNVELMEWLFKKGCPTDNAMRGAAGHGCLVIMKWLLKKGSRMDDSRILNLAAMNGSLPNMKWLLDNGCPIDGSNIMRRAVLNGSLANLKWLVENGCPVNSPSLVASSLVFGSSLQNLKWLLENECPVNKTVKNLAIEEYGSFERLLRLLKVDPSIVVTCGNEYIEDWLL